MDQSVSFRKTHLRKGVGILVHSATVSRTMRSCREGYCCDEEHEQRGWFWDSGGDVCAGAGLSAVVCAPDREVGGGGRGVVVSGGGQGWAGLGDGFSPEDVVGSVDCAALVVV